jgi:hypothetical protein
LPEEKDDSRVDKGPSGGGGGTDAITRNMDEKKRRKGNLNFIPIHRLFAFLKRLRDSKLVCLSRRLKIC